MIQGLFVFRNNLGAQVDETSNDPTMPLRCASSLAKARGRVFPLGTLHDTGFGLFLTSRGPEGRPAQEQWPEVRDRFFLSIRPVFGTTKRKNS